MSKMELHEEVIRLLKIQRHDFVNHLQVIHAMIQLGKPEKALLYIEELGKNPSTLITDELTFQVEQLTGKLKTGA